MPKGKKKGKGDKKKKDGGKEAPDKSQEKKEYEVPPPSQKEILLKKELKELDGELYSLKEQVDQLKVENDWLQEEADRTRLDNQDYQTYITRRAQKRQSLIVSLSDQNRVELHSIQQQREELLKKYEERKAELTDTLLQKECELAKLNQEISLLEPYRALQQEQEEEIARLEKAVEEKQFEHENHIRAVKTLFLKEQRSFEIEAEKRVHLMASKADKKASDCLKEQTQRIRTENKYLRIRLQELIDQSNCLQGQKKHLEIQYHKLLQEQQFNNDLQKIRGFPGTLSGPNEINVTSQHSFPRIARR